MKKMITVIVALAVIAAITITSVCMLQFAVAGGQRCGVSGRV